MRLLNLVLFVLILLLQYPFWLGKGGWFNMLELKDQVQRLEFNNQALAARNNALEAEVQDLKTGKSAVEELARNELDMIRPDEIFVQILK